MSKQTTQHGYSNASQQAKDIFQIYQKNFGKYFNEVEKAVPQNFRSVSSCQITFLETWKNTVDAVLETQKKYAQKAQLDTQVPQAASRAIDRAVDGLIKAQLVQDQFVNAAIEATEKNVKSFYESAEEFAEFQNNLIESCFTSFKNVKN